MFPLSPPPSLSLSLSLSPPPPLSLSLSLSLSPLPPQVRTSCSGGSSKESTPEATRNTPEAAKLSDGPRFSLKPLSSNKRKKKRVSPRTSPRILTEDAVDLAPKKGEGGGVVDPLPAVNSVSVVRSLGGTAPTVLSQLRRGSVEQAIKGFEKLHTTD